MEVLDKASPPSLGKEAELMEKLEKASPSDGIFP